MCDWIGHRVYLLEPLADFSGCWHEHPTGVSCDHRQSNDFQTSPETIPLSEARAISNTEGTPYQESVPHVFPPRRCWDRREASKLHSLCSVLYVFPRFEASFCELEPFPPSCSVVRNSHDYSSSSALPHYGLCHHHHKVGYPTNCSGQQKKAFGSCALKLLEITGIQVGNEMSPVSKPFLRRPSDGVTTADPLQPSSQSLHTTLGGVLGPMAPHQYPGLFQTRASVQMPLASFSQTPPSGPPALPSPPSLSSEPPLWNDSSL